jgi:hypothetical protein
MALIFGFKSWKGPIDCSGQWKAAAIGDGACIRTGGVCLSMGERKGAGQWGRGSPMGDAGQHDIRAGCA